MKIAVLGAGAYGTALGETLRKNQHEIFYYDPFKYPEVKLEDVISATEISLITVPSNIVESLIPELPAERPMILATKGFLSLEPFLRFSDFMIISGGAFAEDVLAEKPATLTATNPLVRELFENEWLKIEISEDKLGILLCGSFKNIFAIGSGYRGLTFGTKEFDEYILATREELERVLVANDCKAETTELSCGIVDLRLTCGSATSRNYTFGQELKADAGLIERIVSGEKKLETTTEGYSAAKLLVRSDLVLPEDMPILDEILSFLRLKDAKTK